MSDNLIDTTVGTGQEQPVDTAPAGEAAPGLEAPASPPPSTPAVEPEPAPAEVTPEPEPMFRLPGQGEQPIDESGWLRQQYAAALQQMSAMQQQLQELQFKDMPEEERSVALQQQRVTQLEQYVQQVQEQQALNEWQRYWGQFVADPATIRQMSDPVAMGHHVVTNLHKQAKTFQAQLAAKDAEIAALKKVAGTPQPGPAVTTGAQGSPSKYTFRDLIKDPDKFNALMRKAEMGLLQDGEIPPLT